MENKDDQEDVFDAWQKGKNALKWEKQSATNDSSSTAKIEKKPTEVAGNAFVQDASATQTEEKGAMSYVNVDKPRDNIGSESSEIAVTYSNASEATTEHNDDSEKAFHPMLENVPDVKSEVRNKIDYEVPEFDTLEGAVHVSEIQRYIVEQVLDSHLRGDDLEQTAATISQTFAELCVGDLIRPDISQHSTAQPKITQVNSTQPKVTQANAIQPQTAPLVVTQPGTSRRRVDLTAVALPALHQPDITPANDPDVDVKAKKYIFTFGMNMRYVTGDEDVDFGMLKGIAVLNNFEWVLAGQNDTPTIIPSQGKKVYGLVYKLEGHEQAAISLLGCAVDMVRCVVELGGNPMDCMFYLARGQMGGIMSAQKRVLLIQAFNDALNHGMPAEYVDECLQKVYSVDSSVINKANTATVIIT